MRKNTIVFIICSVILSCSFSHASKQTDEVELRSFASLASRVKRGNILHIRQFSGDLVSGRFHSIDESGALVITGIERKPAAGREAIQTQRRLAKSSIQRIVVEKKHSRAKGTMIGAGVGLGLAATAGLARSGKSGVSPELAALVAAPFVAGGAIVGYLLSKGPDKRVLVYDADPPNSSVQWRVYPLITPDRRGAMISLSF